MEIQEPLKIYSVEYIDLKDSNDAKIKITFNDFQDSQKKNTIDDISKDLNNAKKNLENDLGALMGFSLLSKELKVNNSIYNENKKSKSENNKESKLVRF